jgi:hypothetical protein
MTERSRPYSVARAAVKAFLDRYEAERKRRPASPGLTYAQLVDAIVLEAALAVDSMPRQRVSDRARAAFERLVADMPDDRGDIALVREELIGRPPLAPDRLPDAITARFKSSVISRQVMEILKQHNWGPLQQRKGRRPSAPVEYRYCPHHGAAAEFRRYNNGAKNTKGYNWRCWLCLQETRARSRGKRPQQVQP